MRKPKTRDKTKPRPPAAAEMLAGPAAAGQQRLALWLSLALVGVTLLVYCPVLDCDFIDLDDLNYVVDNPQVQTGLTPATARWALTTFDCGNWHPLTWLSLLLDRTLYGGIKASGFHLTNLVIHLLSVVLLFHFWRRTTGALWPSAFVAALFALHPLHVESVAWVAERKDVLSALFWILTMWAYAFYAASPTWRRYLVVTVAFALGLAAKPMLVTLPFVLLLLDFWPLVRREQEAGGQPERASFFRWRRLVMEKIPLLVLACGSCVLTILAQGQAEAMASLDRFPINLRILNAFRTYVCYLYMTVWPFDLAIIYQHPPANVLIPQGLMAAIVVLAITIGVILARRRRYLPVGWFWYLGTLTPVIGFVQVGAQSMADRYTYIPLIGIFVAAAWGIADLAEAVGWRSRRAGLAALAAAVVTAMIALTWFQLGMWRDRATVWLHAVDVSKNSPMAHNRLGAAYAAARMPEKALASYTRAVQLYPDAAPYRFDLAVALLNKGDAKQAYDQLRLALQFKPRWSELHYQMAVVCVLLPEPRLDEARAEIRQALELGSYRDAVVALAAYIEHKLGHAEEAARLWQKSRQLNPNWPELANGKARLYLAGEHATPWNALNAWYFSEQACLATNGKNGDFLETLAAAQAALGRFEEATQTLRQAIALSPSTDSAHRQSLQDRLQTYERDRH